MNEIKTQEHTELTQMSQVTSIAELVALTNAFIDSAYIKAAQLAQYEHKSDNPVDINPATFVEIELQFEPGSSTIRSAELLSSSLLNEFAIGVNFPISLLKELFALSQVYLISGAADELRPDSIKENMLQSLKVRYLIASHVPLASNVATSIEWSNFQQEPESEFIYYLECAVSEENKQAVSQILKQVMSLQS